MSLDPNEESLSDTEDSDHSKTPSSPPTHSGTCSKWTNYIHGWQERFICLKDGTLAYYKSENETGFGCRGAISITKAVVKLHEFDECRFDVSVGDCVWYLRADCLEARNKWVESIENYKHYLDSGYGSEASLRRHGSALSLGSISVSSMKKGWGLMEKINEVETYRDILCRQIDSLQSYLDSYGEVLNQTVETASGVNTGSLPGGLSPSTSSFPSKSHRRVWSVTNPRVVTDCGDSIPIPLDVGDKILTLNGASSINNGNSNCNLLAPNGHSRSSSGTMTVKPICDFKGEAITFKATTAGILATLTHCIDMMQQREESWKKRLDKEIEKRRKLEEMIKNGSFDTFGNIPNSVQTSTEVANVQSLGPDYEEGPHSKIKEEEFFDALDAMLDKADQQHAEKMELKNLLSSIGEPSSAIPETVDHKLWPEIDELTRTQLYFAQLEVDESSNNGDGTLNSSPWTLFAEEGELRLYKRELEVDGLVCDPLKAVHTVRGVTAHEMCYHFFSPEVRWDWENTLESMKVVEEINPNTLVFHQIHKRVWPAAQRDTLFWSHIRRVKQTPSPSESPAKSSSTKNSESKTEPHDIWIVCNNSTDAYDVPLGRCLRMKMTVSLTCETYIADVGDRPVTRDDISCRIIYCSTINPGGWAPASVLRALYKREYPKFLKRFTQYVIEAQTKKPILF